MTKNISNKAKTAKRKAHLALTAFLAVAVLAFTLTAVGLFDYLTLDVGVQANVPVAPVAVVAQTAGSNLVQGD